MSTSTGFDTTYEIIKRKGATYYGIAMAVARIAECIMKDERAILPVYDGLGFIPLDELMKEETA